MLIGLMGYAYNEHNDYVGAKRVGKDTVARMMEEIIVEEKLPFRCHHFSFADALKDMVCSIYKVTREQMEQKKDDPQPHLQGWSYRRLLEVMGTDIVRRMSGADIWLDKVMFQVAATSAAPSMLAAHCLADLSWPAMFESTDDAFLVQMRSRFEELCTEYNVPPPPLVDPCNVITDVRFPNEYHRLRQAGAYLVQVKRLLPGEQAPTLSHPSNRLYPDMVPHFVLENNGTQAELKERVRCMLHGLIVQIQNKDVD